MTISKNYTKYSFWDLLNEYIIQIPIIQRDYAQGRLTNDVDTIRSGFLDSLFRALSNGNSLDFDFIYGSVKEAGVLEPLDGQQRLTTLFLLHWYLSNREDRLEETKTILRKFTYETRASSREFCIDLINKSVELPVFRPEGEVETFSLSATIIDSPWFFLSWKKDPTIQSMLVMLNAIHEKFYNTESLLDKLIAKNNPTVTFQFLNIDDHEFKLTDELYIKMNARGKPLTEFENFKAKYEQFLIKVDPNSETEFAKNIDSVWTDYFWKYREDNVIDKPFMRFFYFITEMLWHSKKQSANTLKLEYAGNTPKITFAIIESIYSNKDHIKFLFSVIKHLVNIDDTDAYFNKLFSTFDHVSDKVALFEVNTNLFKRCLTGDNFTIKQKILLFATFNFWIAYSNTTITSNLLDYLRIIRNLISRLRQLQQIGYEPNLRYENIKSIISGSLSLLSVNVYQTILSKQSIEGFSRESLSDEIEKATLITNNPTLKPIIFELEDNDLLQGSVHNIIKTGNPSLLGEKVKSFLEIWKLDYSLVVRALLTIDDYAIEIGNSALGSRYFFGNSDYWYTVLTLKGERAIKVEETVKGLIKNYQETKGANANDKLNTLISNWLNKNQDLTWRYYFIRYSPITAECLNLFAWKNDFEIRSLTGMNLVSYHINPFVKTVCSIFSNEKICNLDASYGRWSEESPLVLKNGILLYCKEDGWWIWTPANITFDESLISKYCLTKVDNSIFYKLTEYGDKDRIEIAVEFVNRIYQLL